MSKAEKTHGLSQKIQGTYFKISALYFKIYALCFSQQAMCFFTCPETSLFSSVYCHAGNHFSNANAYSHGFKQFLWANKLSSRLKLLLLQ